MYELEQLKDRIEIVKAMFVDDKEVFCIDLTDYSRNCTIDINFLTDEYVEDFKKMLNDENFVFFTVRETKTDKNLIIKN